MSALYLPHWVARNEERLWDACLACGEQLLTAADEVERMWVEWDSSAERGPADIERALEALLELLLELLQTRLLVVELVGGVRLHPAGQPTAEEVARTLNIVRNIFIKAATSERDEADELAMRLLNEDDSLSEVAELPKGGRL